MPKYYPFSNQKHAHDIEFYANHLYSVMWDMDAGNTPMDEARYKKLHSMYYGPLMQLRYAMKDRSDGRVTKLTGEEIGLAKKVVAWAAEARSAANRDENKVFTVYCKAGSVSHKIYSFGTEEEAVKFCDSNHWEWNYNGGLVWDLIIEEE